MLFAHSGCSFAMKATLMQTPLVSTFVRGMQVVPIDRASAESQAESRKNISKRLADSRYPQMCIFPQGTTTQQNKITRFKTGTF